MAICLVFYAILNIINSRYLCLAYVYPLYITAIRILKLKVYTNIDAYIFLIGVLHFAEGISIYLAYSIGKESKNLVKRDKTKTRECHYSYVTYDKRKRKIKNKMVRTDIYILPLVIPVATRYEVLQSFKSSIKPIVSLGNASHIFNEFVSTSLLFFVMTHQVKGEEQEIDVSSCKIETVTRYHNKNRSYKSEGLMLIAFSIFTFSMYFIARHKATLEYLNLLAIVIAHEMIYRLKSKKKN